MKVKAIKMHGQGNDYVFLDLTDNPFFHYKNWRDNAIRLSNRHFGIGGDGLVLISSTPPAIRIFNADGSEASTCGTALRCAAFYLSQKQNVKKLDINTPSGAKHCIIKPDNIITVNMGKASIKKEGSIEVGKQKIEGYIINIGNRHFCTFNNKLLHNDESRYQKIEKQEDVNVENIIIHNDKSINVKVWERGSGFTLACGSGACAAAFISHKRERCQNKVKVDLPGGEVSIEITPEDCCLLTGEVEKVFETEVEILCGN